MCNTHAHTTQNFDTRARTRKCIRNWKAKNTVCMTNRTLESNLMQAKKPCGKLCSDVYINMCIYFTMQYAECILKDNIKHYLT